MTPPLKTILLADDDPNLRDILRRLLTQQGYQILGEAHDGQQAVDLARRLHPHLVLLDLHMPVLDGAEAARQILEAGTTAVVILTADTSTEAARTLLDLGVSAYITKPVELAQLIPALESAFHHFETQRVLRNEKKELQESLETRKLLDKAKGILMEQQGYTENEAHKTIMKMSQDQGISVKELCRSLIQVRMVLGGKSRTVPRKAA